jgi:hypothetical protein
LLLLNSLTNSVTSTSTPSSIGSGAGNGATGSSTVVLVAHHPLLVHLLAHHHCWFTFWCHHIICGIKTLNQWIRFSHQLPQFASICWFFLFSLKKPYSVIILK